jgi:hypothetical protein
VTFLDWDGPSLGIDEDMVETLCGKLGIILLVFRRFSDGVTYLLLTGKNVCVSKTFLYRIQYVGLLADTIIFQ